MTNIVEKANQALIGLEKHPTATSDWETTLKTMVPDAIEAQKYIDKIKAAGNGMVVGLVQTSMTVFSELLPLALPSEINAVVKLLKDEKRIFQCGRGRGKCVIILSKQPLAANEEAVAAPAPADLSVMSRNLRDGINEFVADLTAMKDLVTRYESELQKKDQIIDQLRNEASIRHRTTWF